MKAATLVTLNMRELDRLKVIQAVVDMGVKPRSSRGASRPDGTPSRAAGAAISRIGRGGTYVTQTQQAGQSEA